MVTNGFQHRLTRRLRSIERLRLDQENLRRQEAPLLQRSLLRELGRDLLREFRSGLWQKLALVGGSLLFICLGALAAHVSNLLFVTWLAVFCGLVIYAVGATIYAIYKVTTALVVYFTWKDAR